MDLGADSDPMAQHPLQLASEGEQVEAPVGRECGVSPKTARRSVVWALKTLLASLGEEAQAATGPGPLVVKPRTKAEKEKEP